MSNEENLTSIKELASKLKVSDALLKKIIKDFDVETDRAQKKVFLNAAAATTVREVLALRASGKKNQEIKEMFDAAKKANQEEAQAIEEASNPIEEVPSADIKDVKPERKVRKDKFRSNRTKIKKEESTEPSAEVLIDEETVENIKHKEKIPVAKKEEELDISSYLDETDNLDEEISLSLKLAESALSDDGEDLGDEEPVFEEDDDHEDEEEEAPRYRQTNRADDGRLNPRRIKRRQFSFRYIQRQIANDAKRVHYIKQKLKRGRLSTQEKMNLEESLEQRSKLLSGWVHLLRWVKS